MELIKVGDGNAEVASLTKAPTSTEVTAIGDRLSQLCGRRASTADGEFNTVESELLSKADSKVCVARQQDSHG